VIIPTPLMSFTTRRVMLSRWVNGVKLSNLPPNEIRDLIKLGQEVFLTQLLDIGFFHGDPHPGNMLKIVDGPDAGKLCLLDFGLVAEVPRVDRDIIVAAVVHLGTRNWDGLIDDFVRLGFLAEDVNKGTLIPILQRVLGPYLKGGGAQSMKNANFQALSQDLLKVNLEVRFSIPPYVSLLARSVATLEGVALQGDPGYQIVAQAYPFVVRKLLKNENRLSFSALRELLYDPETQRLRPQRLSTMLQASLGVVADSSNRSGFIDFDSAPKDGAPLSEVITFLLSPSARNLRPLLNAELAYGLDLALRRTARRVRSTVQDLLVPRIPFIGLRLPAPPVLPLLVPVPTNLNDDGPSQPGFRVLQVDEVFGAVLPELKTSEDVDLNTFSEALQTGLFNGNRMPELSPQALLVAVQSVLRRDGDRDAGVAEIAQALRSVLNERSTREVLTDDVLLAIARELLRTWRARLAAVVSR
jgi:aarF domain-containing kinase